jgi:tripartite-type tricarboxylate transporter receptor subunit TctC
LAINESLMATRLNYDARKDFSPIIRAAWSPMVLVTHPSVPAKNVAEFLALAKARPGKINFASGGVGTGAHLALELFKTRAGVDVVHVPYKGNGPATSDLLGGQVSAMFLQYAVAKPHVVSGKLVMLATPSGKRSLAIPDVPTIAESGFPGFELYEWYALFLPAGTPKEIVTRLHKEVMTVMASPEMVKRIADIGAQGSKDTPEQFAQFLAKEDKVWGDLVKAIGIQPE